MERARGHERRRSHLLGAEDKTAGTILNSVIFSLDLPFILKRKDKEKADLQTERESFAEDRKRKINLTQHSESIILPSLLNEFSAPRDTTKDAKLKKKNEERNLINVSHFHKYLYENVSFESSYQSEGWKG